jgi:hypothetical protein
MRKVPNLNCEDFVLGIRKAIAYSKIILDLATLKPADNLPKYACRGEAFVV